jgi:hypothetical protein
VVYVVGAQNRVVQRAVEAGPLVDGLRVIRSGLEASDRVVVDGVQRARPGKPVTAQPGHIEPEAQASSAATAAAASSATFAAAP